MEDSHFDFLYIYSRVKQRRTYSLYTPPPGGREGKGREGKGGRKYYRTLRKAYELYIKNEI